MPEMRIWSILLIISELKWCIHLSEIIFLYFNYLVSVTAGGPESPETRQVLRSASVDLLCFWSIRCGSPRIQKNY